MKLDQAPAWGTSACMPNQSALEREIADKAVGVAQWLRAKDRGVLLAMALCLAPFPPVFLVGIALNLLNLRLASLGKIHPLDRPIIYASFVVTAVYIAIWTGLVWSFLHYGQLHAFLAFFKNLVNGAVGRPFFQHTAPDSYLKRV